MLFKKSGIKLIVSHQNSNIMTNKPIAGLIEKIARECGEANADKWTITRIIKQLSEQEEQDIKSLRKKALELLQTLDPKAAATYASFQRMQVRVTNQLVESFDRGNIIRSLLKETEVPRGVAEKIGHEVEEKIKDLEIESINTPLIREMVNVKLLEFGHENIRDQYTRLGLPVFEVKRLLEKGPYGNRAMFAEYMLLRIIPKKLGKMHLSNELFIGELHNFGSKPIATTIVPEICEEPRDTVFKALENANQQSKMFSWQPNISALNAAISSKTNKKDAKEASTLFVKAAKAVFLNRKAIPSYNTIYLFEPEAFSGKGIERESLVSSANTMLKLSEEENPVFENIVAVDTKYKLKLLPKNKPKLVLNCKNKEFSFVNGIAVEGNGLCSFFALNTTLIALNNKGNETAFFEELGRKAKAVKQLDELKRKELSEKEYIKGNGINVSNLKSALALDSLFEASKRAIGAEKEREIISFSEKIVLFLKKRLQENFVLTELKNANALHRFAKENMKLFNTGRRYLEEEKHLRKSSAIKKNYCFEAKAESGKELNELLDQNIRVVRLKGK